MEYFPFDTQRCPLKYGSWAYSQNYINLQHLTVTNGILGEVNFILKKLLSHYNLRDQKEKWQRQKIQLNQKNLKYSQQKEYSLFIYMTVVLMHFKELVNDIL